MRKSTAEYFLLCFKILRSTEINSKAADDEFLKNRAFVFRIKTKCDGKTEYFVDLTNC